MVISLDAVHTSTNLSISMGNIFMQGKLPQIRFYSRPSLFFIVKETGKFYIFMTFIILLVKTQMHTQGCIEL